MNSAISTAPGASQAPFAWFAAGCVITVAVYWQSIAPLINKWLQFDQSLGHALPLFLILCGWMVTLRHRFNAVAREPSIRGVVLVLLGSLGWAAVALGDIELLEQLAVLGILAALAIAVAGWRSALPLAAPMAMLLFCLPVWDEVNDSLVDLSSVAVEWYLRVSSITAYMTGNTVFLPEGTITIAGGCSGLRYLVAGLAIANLAAAQDNLRPKFVLLVNLLATGIMLFVNWFRISAIVTIAYHTHMTTSLVRDHETFGWVIFSVALVPLLLCVRRLPRAQAGS